MASSSDIFRQVASAVDIVDVIGEHLALKRAGREFKCLCPFHDDHRPSMSVVPHKQIFSCFVCGTAGNVFKFTQLYFKMTPGESLRMLAQRAGIKLPELPGRGGQGPQRDKDGLTARERIANTNEWACGFFEKYLRSPQGKAGLDYLHGRGLTDETIAKFRLGFAPDGWTGMVNAAMRLGISNENLFEAGLIKQRQDSSPYDAFRNRVIFPIIDATGAAGNGGRVIAFGGRILEEKRDEAGNVVEAKYLNSPDSKLFNKSESLYGINLARQQVIRTRAAIVVEGYMDVIACHQAGVSNVIATLGTALTPDHARILKNYAQSVILVFDSDDAGRRATDRALEVFVRGSLDIKLTHVPDGKDPCDFCIKNGGEPFQKLVDAATDALTFKWQQLQKQFHGTDSLTGRQEAVTTYLRFVAAALSGDAAGGASAGAAMDPVRRGLLMTKIAGLINMPQADLQATLKKLSQQNQTAYRPSDPPHLGQAQGAESAGSNIEPDAADVQDSSQGGQAPSNKRIDIRMLKGGDAAEGWLLGCLLVEPPLFGKVREDISLTLFKTFPALAAGLLEFFDNHQELADCSFSEIISTLQDMNAELVRQAIELEAKTADWLEPANFSPNHTKMLQHLTKDRGMTLEILAQDSLKELRSTRSTTDPQVEADFATAEELQTPSPPEDAAAAFLKQIQNAQRRNTAGGNRRVVG
ncbi:MAG TPA: DNA primase [Phycisphaerae bacterium]